MTIDDRLKLIELKLDKILNIYEGFVTTDVSEEISFVNEKGEFVCSISDIPNNFATHPKFTKFVVNNLQGSNVKLKNVNDKNDILPFLGVLCNE